MKIALQKIFEVGAQGISLTADGPIAHFAMMRELGANLDPQHLKTFFQHPSDSNQNVHVLLDLAHMLKLVRNSLASERVIISPSGEVKWEYIVKLHSLQESEGLRAGTKLTRKHIDWERCKMKVSLAAQTLSSSVADALDFLREDLKLPDFKSSKATSEFVRVFDSLFDCFNSRSPHGKRFKAPLKEENYHEWISLFAEASIYIRSLKKEDGTPILFSRSRTGYLGFVCAISSFQNLYEDLVVSRRLNFILGYKFSQVGQNFSANIFVILQLLLF